MHTAHDMKVEDVEIENFVNITSALIQFNNLDTKWFYFFKASFWLPSESSSVKGWREYTPPSTSGLNAVCFDKREQMFC